MKKINILFVCRGNRRRSRLAEAYFKKVNKNKNIKVESAGLFRGQPLLKKDILAAKRVGLNINRKPKEISTNLLAWQNITVIVANDVPKATFNESIKRGKKVIKWKISDENIKTNEDYQKLVSKIQKKVDKLIKKLEKSK